MEKFDRELEAFQNEWDTSSPTISINEPRLVPVVRVRPAPPPQPQWRLVTVRSRFWMGAAAISGLGAFVLFISLMADIVRIGAWPVWLVLFLLLGLFGLSLRYLERKDWTREL